MTRLAVALACIACAASAGTPDASLLLRPDRAPLLEALAGRSARPVPRIPARYGVDSGAFARAPFEELRALPSRYPGTTFEVSGPLHPLLDRAVTAIAHPRARGVSAPTGRGVIVAVADTGFDLAHTDLRDDAGKTRVRWALDLTQAPRGVHAVLEARFGLRDSRGNVVRGAVFDAEMIDEAIATGRSPIGDEEGHGTHVASIAAGSPPSGPYVGVAPEASLVLVRVAGGAYPDITAEALEAAAAFAFERADTEQRPCVLNASIGTDFGPHDGSLSWEKALAAHVGAGRPGRAIVVAAGNGGRVGQGVHQAVPLAEREVEVPLALGAAKEGVVRVWVTAAPGSTLRVGLRVANEALSIAPLAYGFSRTREAGGLWTAVLHGPNAIDEISSESRSAIVVASGRFGSPAPRIVLAGEGRADLWFDAAAFAAQGPAGFARGVREGTITEPAVHPELLAVGATVARAAWTSASGAGPFPFTRFVLDDAGGTPLVPARTAPVVDGEVADFSALGPNARDVPKPDVLAPGVAIAAAMSAMATPGTLGSMFTATCASASGALDSRCLQVDAAHALGFGTSMAAPLAAGAIALLFERDPALTAPDVRNVLRRTAHPPRIGSASDPSAFPGELDVDAALAWVRRGAVACVPSRTRGWLVPSRAFAAATGAEAVRVLVQARCIDGSPAELPGERVRVWGALDDGARVEATAAGDATYAFAALRGRAGDVLKVHAELDGAEVAPTLALPVGAGPWDARYGMRLAEGACACAAAGGPDAASRGHGAATLGAGAVLGVALARRRRRAAQCT
jgi:subtilisin family serine protease